MGNDEFLQKIQDKNKLRKLLKEKKRSYAKLINVPEAIEECISLKADIDAIKMKLDNL